MSIARPTEGRTVELALPRRLRRLTFLLTVLMLLLCGRAAVGAIQDPSPARSGGAAKARHPEDLNRLVKLRHDTDPSARW